MLKIAEKHFDDMNWFWKISENAGSRQIIYCHDRDILQMSKIEDGNVPLTQEIINFEELSQDILTIRTAAKTEESRCSSFKKGKASISFYLWKSAAYETDFS